MEDKDAREEPGVELGPVRHGHLAQVGHEPLCWARNGTSRSAAHARAAPSSDGDACWVTTQPLKNDSGRPVTKEKIASVSRVSPRGTCSASFRNDATKFSSAARNKLGLGLHRRSLRFDP